MRWWCTALLALLLTACGIAAGAPTAEPGQPGSAGHPTWGLLGGYRGVDLADAHRRGVQALAVEMSWAEAEPQRGRLDQAYLGAISRQVQDYRRLGFSVVLNYGLHDAPSWVSAIPGSHLVDQKGNRATGEGSVDLVFNPSLRALAAPYTRAVVRLLGASVSTIRVGGGYWGELDYPAAVGPGPSYWAYSPAAQAAAPDPGWRPCGPGGQAAAGRFVAFYLGALVDYQNWQIALLRQAGYTGTVAVLYPSVSLTPGDVAASVATGLCGSSPAERSGDLARGFTHQRQVQALPRSGVAAWCTWLENPLAIQRLAAYADAAGVPLMGENSSGNSRADLIRSVLAARRYHLAMFFWARAETAYGTGPAARISDYQKAIDG